MPGFADDSRHRGSGVLFASESAAVEAREKPNCALRRRKAAGIPPLPFDSTAAEGLRNRLISREFVVLASDLPQSLQESRTLIISTAEAENAGGGGFEEAIILMVARLADAPRSCSAQLAA